MMGPTHRALAVTAATSVSVACNAPLSAAAVIVWAAWTTAKLPDRMERWFRARHRWWTHFLLTTVLVGLLFGATVAGILYAATAGVAKLVGPDGRELVDVGLQITVGMGVLTALGALCGTVTHTLADACTRSGTPLLWPVVRRPLWLVPEPWRTTTGRYELDPKTQQLVRTREPTRGELRWRYGAWAVTGLLVASIALPELLAFWRALLDALESARPR